MVAALKIQNQEGKLYFEVAGPKDFKYEADSQRLHVEVYQPDIHFFQAMAEASIRVPDTLTQSTPVTVEAYSDASVTLAGVRAPSIALSSYTHSTVKAHVHAPSCIVSAYTGSWIDVKGSAAHLDLTASSAQIQATGVVAESGSATAMDKAVIEAPHEIAHRRELSDGKIVSTPSTSKK